MGQSGYDLREKMSDDTTERLQELAEGTNTDVEELQEQYDEALAEVQERTPDTLPDDQVETIAFGQVSSNVTSNISTGRSSESVRILSVGRRRVMENFGDDNDTVLLSFGIVQPEDDSKRTQLGVIFNEESTGVDAYDAKDKFRTYSTVEAEYSVRESENLSNTYVLNSTGDTVVSEVDSDMSFEEKREWVNGNFFDDRATLAEIDQYISQGGNDGWPDEFGADLQRIRGTVADWFVNDEGTNGGYVIQDESLVDPNDYPEEVVGEKRVPGITAWVDPAQMDYGENSVCDFYGAISRMDDGQIVMNIVGIAPIMANDIEYTADNTSTSDSSVEERSI